MNRKNALQICNHKAMNHFAVIYDLPLENMQRLKGYFGAANIIYRCQKNNEIFYLRISFRPDRNPEMIASEVEFINYLAENGLRVALPVKSQNGNLMELFSTTKTVFTAVLFTEAKGEFLYKNGFELPKGVTLKQYMINQGEMLGKMHQLSSNYQPAKQIVRFDCLERHKSSLDWLLQPGQEIVKYKINQVISEIRQIKQNKNNFGLTHNDIHDMNFTLDYSNSNCDLTLFDFDDCGFNYFMNELACFWEKNTGWIAYETNADKRREFMQKTYNNILDGYHKYHSLGKSELEQLPLFLKAAQIENILENYRELHKTGKDLSEGNEEIRYHSYCMENDLEFLGFFDKVFEKNQDFCL